MMLGGLADLLHPHPRPRVAVAVGVGPDLPVELVVGEADVAVPTEVPVHARATQVGAREAVGQGQVGRDDADAAHAHLEDLVAEDELVHQVAEVPDADHRGLGVRDPALRQVVLQAADAVEVGVEAAARDRLDLVEHELAVPEGQEGRGLGAELQREVPDEEADVGEAGQLEEDRADPLGPVGGLDLHELLGGQDERHLVGEAAQPIDAVHQGGDLGVGPDLAELLVAAVHVAAEHVGRDDLLAVEAGHEAQRAVGGGVLRTHVEGHAVVGLELDVHAPVSGLRVGVRELLGVGQERHASSPSASSSASSPGMGSTSTMPGQGFTTRARRGNSLRSGWPSNSVGR